MTNMSIQPLWLTHFIEILLVLEFQLTNFIVGAFSYNAHFRPQISSNVFSTTIPCLQAMSATLLFSSLLGLPQVIFPELLTSSLLKICVLASTPDIPLSFLRLVSQNLWAHPSNFRRIWFKNVNATKEKSQSWSSKPFNVLRGMLKLTEYA